MKLKFRIFSRKNVDKFRQKLSSTNMITDDCDVNKQTKYFLQKFQNI